MPVGRLAKDGRERIGSVLKRKKQDVKEYTVAIN
jgi:hypothetical protein